MRASPIKMGVIKNIKEKTKLVDKMILCLGLRQSKTMQAIAIAI